MTSTVDHPLGSPSLGVRRDVPLSNTISGAYPHQATCLGFVYSVFQPNDTSTIDALDSVLFEQHIAAVMEYQSGS